MLKILLALVLGVALLAAGVTAVAAHARYDHSTPMPEQVLPASPARIDIYTVQDMRKIAGANEITVTGPSGTNVDAGATAVDDANRRHFSVALQPNLPAGRYLVSFKTLSDQDGEMDNGSFAFYVGTGPTAAQKTADAALTLTAKSDTPTSSGSTSHTGLYLVIAAVAALAIVVAVFGWTLSRRRPRAL